MPRDGTATRERILDAAERLVIDRGFAATSVDAVIAASRTCKGAFFHHFDSKIELAEHLLDRYAAADIAHLEAALEAVGGYEDAAERLLAFLALFEEGADELMATQSSCLCVAVLSERQLLQAGTSRHVVRAVEAWRVAIARLFREALDARRPGHGLDCDALADHVFVTFEGAFVLCRSSADPSHMRAQLQALGQLVEALLGACERASTTANSAAREGVRPSLRG